MSWNVTWPHRKEWKVPSACTLKRVLGFIVLVGLWVLPYCSAAYLEPPHSAVAQHNDALGPSLLGVRTPLGGERPRSNPLRAFAIRVHAVYPSVDHVASSAHVPRALWGWTYDAQAAFDWDRSLSSCGSNRSRMRLSGAGGQFRLHSEMAGSPSRVFDNPASPASVGFDSSQLASGQGPLKVWLNGRLHLEYTRDVETVQCRPFCYWNGCSIQSWVETTQVRERYAYDAVSPTFSVALVHPVNQTVLLTPWIHNFSVALPQLSAFLYANTTLYRLDAQWDGTLTVRKRHSGFDVRQDGWSIQSVHTTPHASTETHDAMPARVYQNPSKTFQSALRIDQDVPRAVAPGIHTWTIKGFDVFGDTVDWSHALYAHTGTELHVDALQDDGPSQTRDVRIRLTDRAGTPLAGKAVQLETPQGFVRLTTDGNGVARTRVTLLRSGANRLVARFIAQDGFASSFADHVAYVVSEANDPSDVLVRHDGLLLGLTMVLALCIVRFR